MEKAVTKLVGSSVPSAVSTPEPKKSEFGHDPAGRTETSKPAVSSEKGEITASLGSGGIWQRSLQAETASKDWVRTISLAYRDNKGNNRVTKMKEFRLGRDKHLFRFTDPADFKGMAILSGGPGKLYVYLPAFRKVRRIATHVANQGFAGSDYSYMDVIRSSWLAQLAVERTQERSDHYIVDLKAQSSAGAVYAKAQAKIRKEDALIEQLIFFERSGAKSKVLTRSQCRKQGKYAHCFQEEMKDVKKGSVTRLNVESLKTDTNLKEKIFSRRALMRR
jgi:hypothetical protein